MKKIIHVDMDCFYAQVEMRDNPKLKNVPLAIGGLPGTRSVLCTSNYIARKFGVKAAMPTDFAMKLCPNLVVLVPQFRKYSEVSGIINEIFNKYSPKVEAVSLDEAYLDVSHYPHAAKVALEIKNEIFKVTGLTASVGLATNKFLAKIASDWKKPNGFFAILPHEVDTFIKDLPVKLIPGVGKKSLEIMNSLRIETCTDLLKVDFKILNHYFGKFSMNLIEYAKGIDHRDVINDWERKSFSMENTYINDLQDFTEIKKEFVTLYDEFFERLDSYFNSEGQKKVKKYFIKIKFNDFSRAQSEETIFPLESIDDLKSSLTIEKFEEHLKFALSKKNLPIRLIGLGVRFVSTDLVHNSYFEQLSLLPLCG